MSIQLQATINWATAAVSYLPLTVGANNEPAITNANNVMQLFLSPALGAWPWNRAVATFLTVVGQQDYTVNGLQWGWLEKASLQPAATITNVAGSGTVATITAANSFTVGALVTISGLTNTAFNGTFTITTQSATQFQFASSYSLSSTADSGVAASGKAHEITDIHNTAPLGVSSDQARAGSIAVQQMTVVTSNTYNVTFRLISVPQAVYQVTLVYQEAPDFFTVPTSTWGAIPDFYAYIYNRLFLGETLEPIDAQRAQVEKQRGILALVASAEGMELKDKAIFIAQYLNIDAQSAMNMIDVQQGAQSKGGQ